MLAERIFDRWSYLLVYTASGIAGSLASLWWHPGGVGAGASGAIFGLAGGLIAVLYLGKLPISKAALKPTLKSLIMFAAYNLFFGLAPGIDNSAHLGGLAAGLGLGAVLARSVPQPPEIRARQRNYASAGTLVPVRGSYLNRNYSPRTSRHDPDRARQPEPSASQLSGSGGTCFASPAIIMSLLVGPAGCRCMVPGSSPVRLCRCGSGLGLASVAEMVHA